VVERHADVLLGLALAAHGQHVQALVLADVGDVGVDGLRDAQRVVEEQ
jgi:hypothetical protein